MISGDKLAVLGENIFKEDDPRYFLAYIREFCNVTLQFLPSEMKPPVDEAVGYY